MNEVGKYLHLVVVLAILCSCGIDGGDGEDGSENNIPGPFSVSVGEVTQSTAFIEWTAASDPDGDKITYTVELDVSPVETNDPIRATFLSRDSWLFTGLDANETYVGRVIAVDANGGRRSVSFSFTTD